MLSMESLLGKSSMSSYNPAKWYENVYKIKRLQGLVILVHTVVILMAFDDKQQVSQLQYNLLFPMVPSRFY